VSGKAVFLWTVAGGLTVVTLYAIYAMRGGALRYVLAMVCAIASALVTMIVIASPIASWITNHMRFESPDGAANVHMLSFLAINISALVIGWSVGWLAGSRLIAGRWAAEEARRL
jgi:hypothetical protein